MARTTYGGTITDVLLSPVTIGSTQVAGLPASQSLQVWNLANSLQLTDVQDGSGIALPSGLVVTTTSGGIPAFRGPDGYTGAIRLKHPSTGLSWLVQPQTSGSGSGTGLPNTLVVAASDSGITSADYVCDGTADDVQINAALAVLRAGKGGMVLLTAGTFNLAAPLLIEGFDDVDVEQDLYLKGQGPKNTTLVVGSGVSCGIRWAKCVRSHIADLGLTIGGASDGIQAVAPTAPAAGHRSAWLSSISRVQVLGPFTGTDTGWAFDLDNVFRATLQDIEVNGTTNGIRWQSTNAAFNPGDAVMSRCFVDIGTGGNGGAAYAFESTAGQVNQITAICCHGIGSSSATGQVCWKFIGSSAHIRTIGCNAEQFATTVQTASAAYDVDIDLVHVTLRNGSTLVDFDGYGSKVRCGLAYVEPAATVTLVDDDNGYALKPNILGPVSMYAETGSTVNADVVDTLLLRDITWDGPGTIAAAVKVPPSVLAAKTMTLTDAATITLDASRGSYHRVTLTASRTLAAPTNPTDGQRLLLEVVQNATGGWTLTFNAVYGFGTITAANTTTANRRDIYEFVYSATANRWWVVNASKNLV